MQMKGVIEPILKERSINMQYHEQIIEELML